MKRISAVLLSLVLSLAAAAPVRALEVSAAAAILVCAESGAVLFEKDADRRLPMASTTKMMTALLAIEACTPERTLLVTDEMVNVEGTSMGLQAGDTVTLRALVYGMLLASGNDAANAAAYALAGSPAAFATQMNARAQALGMTQTQFVTPSGLDDPAHYSTARDLAALACACIRNPEFRAVCSAKTARLSYGNPPYPRTLTNHNRLLWRDESVIGVKTGFTKKSGRCLVSAAERDGLTFVAVTLNAPDDWEDHLALYAYGAERCRPVTLTYDVSGQCVPVFGGMRPSVKLRLAHAPVYPADGAGFTCELRLRPYCFAPVAASVVVGEAAFFSGGKLLASVPVLTAERIERQAGPPEETAQPNRLQRWLQAVQNAISEFFNRGEHRDTITDAAAEVPF